MAPRTIAKIRHSSPARAQCVCARFSRSALFTLFDAPTAKTPLAARKFSFLSLSRCSAGTNQPRIKVASCCDFCNNWQDDTVGNLAIMEIASTIQVFNSVRMGKTKTHGDYSAWLDGEISSGDRGTARRLAEFLDVTPDIISKMRPQKNGRKARRPTAKENLLIEKFFGKKSPISVASEDRDVNDHGTDTHGLVPQYYRSVPVIGIAHAGAQMTILNLQENYLDEVAGPPNSTDATRAIEIRGDSLGPMFDRWYAFYDDVRRPATYDLIGKLCVVGLEDGRVMIKRIGPSKQARRFDLLSASDDEPIRDVVIDWAAVVIALTMG